MNGGQKMGVCDDTGVYMDLHLGQRAPSDGRKSEQGHQSLRNRCHCDPYTLYGQVAIVVKETTARKLVPEILPEAHREVHQPEAEQQRLAANLRLNGRIASRR